MAPKKIIEHQFTHLTSNWPFLSTLGSLLYLISSLRSGLKMDTEKVFQADTYSTIQPQWSYCQNCRTTQKKHYVLKWILGFGLLGLLALNTYQSFKISRTSSSPSQLQQHHTTSIEVDEDCHLPAAVETSPMADDSSWNFSTFNSSRCQGVSQNFSGEGGTACRPFGQAYNSTSVFDLGNLLKICLYGEANCKSFAVNVTNPAACQSLPPVRSYVVTSKANDCKTIVGSA